MIGGNEDVCRQCGATFVGCTGSICSNCERSNCKHNWTPIHLSRICLTCGTLEDSGFNYVKKKEEGSSFNF